MIAEYLHRHRDEKPLVIFDTLGKVKPPKRSGEESFQVDYSHGSKLKILADSAPGSTILIIHHTAKPMPPISLTWCPVRKVWPRRWISFWHLIANVTTTRRFCL